MNRLPRVVERLHGNTRVHHIRERTESYVTRRWDGLYIASDRRSPWFLFDRVDHFTNSRINGVFHRHSGIRLDDATLHNYFWFNNTNWTTKEEQKQTTIIGEDTGDPPQTPEMSPIYAIGPFRPNRFMNVVLDNDQRKNMTNVFIAIREENTSKDEFQSELWN